MARATRSSTQHESSSSKKRKRSADSIQLPPAKQFRPEPALADSPINKEYAQKILDVLEMYFSFLRFQIFFHSPLG